MTASSASMVQPLLVQHPPLTPSIETDENMQSLKRAAPLFMGPCLTTSLGGVIVVLGKNSGKGNQYEQYSQAEAIGILAACFFTGALVGGAYLYYKDPLHKCGWKIRKMFVKQILDRITLCCCGAPENRPDPSLTPQGSNVYSDENLHGLKQAAPVFIGVGLTTLIGGLIILMGKKSKTSQGSSYAPFTNAEAIGILAASVLFGAALGGLYLKNRESIHKCVTCIPACTHRQITSLYKTCNRSEDDDEGV